MGKLGSCSMRSVVAAHVDFVIPAGRHSKDERIHLLFQCRDLPIGWFTDDITAVMTDLRLRLVNGDREDLQKAIFDFRFVLERSEFTFSLLDIHDGVKLGAFAIVARQAPLPHIKPPEFVTDEIRGQIVLQGHESRDYL